MIVSGCKGPSGVEHSPFPLRVLCIECDAGARHGETRTRLCVIEDARVSVHVFCRRALEQMTKSVLLLIGGEHKALVNSGLESQGLNIEKAN